jgi:ferredoxin-NADP reductase
MYVFFERREEIVPGIWEYSFRPDHSVDFVPGQYVDLFLQDLTGDPRGGSRTFSITSLPADPSIRFITKHFGQQSPYKQALQSLPEGGSAWTSDAMGDLVLPKSTSTPLVFVAGGIGIASYASMLRDLIDRKEERSIFLFYYLRSRRERIFKDLTSAYPLQLHDMVIAPNTLTAQEIKDSTPPNALIYLSGSQAFVERLRTDLETLGTLRSQIVFDYYDGYTEL